MDKPVVAQRAPYVVEVEEGKTYAWCACGRSAKQPWCDGAHRGSGMAPLKFTAEKSETLYLCGCKATRKGPFCDGSHSTL